MLAGARRTRMTVAEETRAAVRERPFLFDALRAGVVNYAAAAATLDVDADPDAVATALRRFAAELEDGTTPPVGAGRVTMERRVGAVDDEAAESSAALITVAGTAYAVGAGDATAVVARGEVGPDVLERVLGRLRAVDTIVEAAAVTSSALVVVVGRRAGADALRVVEAALEE